MEVIINRHDIEEIIKSYKNIDKSFYFKSYVPINNNMWRCKFFLDGKECTLDVYLKKKSVTLSPSGVNCELSVKVAEYISEKGFDSKTYSKNVSVKINRLQINQMLKYICDECNNLISYEIDGSIIRFKGYNEDTLVLNYYEEKSIAVIQGKPFFVFGVVINYIAMVTDLDVSGIIELSNKFSDMNNPVTLIRDDMKSKLGDSYKFLGDILLKFISGSFSLLRSTICCEEYSGYLVGTFKALEGYMKKVLSEKYNYTFSAKENFSMLGKGPDGKCDLSRNHVLSSDEELYWNKLYIMYTDKRNVYLHATVNPLTNKVVESKKEASELTDEIIDLIKESYEIFYK